MDQEKIRCIYWKNLLKKAVAKWDKKIENKCKNIENVTLEYLTLKSDSKNSPPDCVKNIVDRWNSYFSEDINLGDGTVAAALATLTLAQIDAIIDIINEIEELDTDDDE